MTRHLPRWRHAVIVAPLVLYFLTAVRVPGWLDASLITYYASQLRMSAWVNHHNLFTVLGHSLITLFRNVDPHYVLVLTCGFFGALTVYLVFLVGLEIARPSAALLGAFALMVSHSLWWHSTMVEVYTLNSAIMAGFVLLILRYLRTDRLSFLCGAFFLWGLGCSNHILMGLFLPAFLVLAVILAVRKRIHGAGPWIIIVLCFLAGASLFIALFMRDLLAAYAGAAGRTGEGFRAFMQALGSTFDRATGGGFKDHMFTSGLDPEQKRFWRFNYVFLVFVNYPSVALLLGVAGLAVAWTRPNQRIFLLFLAPAIAAQVIWSANYFIWDMYAFSLPVYLLFSILVIYGAEWALRRGRVTRLALLALAPTLLLPCVLYPQAERWYDSGGFMTRYFNHYEERAWTEPVWRSVGYIASPNKRNYDLTERIARRLFDVLPAGSAIMTNEARLDYPMRLYYQRTLGMRTDIRYLSYFGMFLSDAGARSQAALLDRSLDRSAPTYITSVGMPDRRILTELWLRHDPEADRDAVAELPEDRFVSEFPGVAFVRVDLIPDEGVYIYRIEKKVAPVLRDNS